RLRVPRGIHRDPGPNDPVALAVGGGGCRRGRGDRRQGDDRRDLAHRARRPGRVGARQLAGAGWQRVRRWPPRLCGGAPLAMRPGLLLTFAAMGLATYLTRAPLLVALARRRLPDWLERYFAALPIALITALALPLVLLAPGNAVPGWVTDLPAAAAVAVLARRTGHLLIAVAGGVVLVALLRALLG